MTRIGWFAGHGAIALAWLVVGIFQIVWGDWTRAGQDVIVAVGVVVYSQATRSWYESAYYRGRLEATLKIIPQSRPEPWDRPVIEIVKHPDE